MIFSFILTSLAVATLALLVRSFFSSHQALKITLKTRLPHWLSHAITCGFCNTYWLTLLVMLVIINPLTGLQLPLHGFIADRLATIVTFAIGWTALGLVAVLWRFLYVLIQEAVFYLVQTVNKR